MTVASTTNRKTFAGDSVTTSFGTSPVVFFDSEDLMIFVVNTTTGVATTLTENTDYTVSGGAGSTGTVNLAGGSAPWGALATGTTLVILRDLSLVQEADFVQNDGSDAEVTEDAFDKVTMMLQQLDSRIDRSFVLPDSDVSGASTEIPTPEANTVVGWNSTATALQNYSASDLDIALTTPFSLTLLDDVDASAARSTLDAAQKLTSLASEATPAVGDLLYVNDISEGADNKMTLADAFKIVNAFTEDFAPVATADYLLSYDASASGAKKVRLNQAPLLPQDNFTLANGTDATNDINFGAGSCRDSTNAVNIVCSSALVKQLDATWAAGTGAGGRMSAAAITDTAYHLFAIRKDSDGSGDFGFDTSPTAPTMPSGYTYFRRIGSIRRVGGALQALTVDGKFFQLTTPVLDVDVNTAGTSAVTRTLASVPTGVNLRALITVRVGSDASNDGVRVSDLATADLAPSQTAAPLYQVGAINSSANNSDTGQLIIRTNTSSQIRTRNLLGADANDTLRIVTEGWYDDARPA